MLVLMIAFDSYLTSLIIVGYNEGSILNIKLGSIPIEDFGYLLVVILLVPALFNKFHHAKEKRRK